MIGQRWTHLWQVRSFEFGNSRGEPMPWMRVSCEQMLRRQDCSVASHLFALKAAVGKRHDSVARLHTHLTGAAPTSNHLRVPLVFLDPCRHIGVGVPRRQVAFNASQTGRGAARGSCRHDKTLCEEEAEFGGALEGAVRGRSTVQVIPESLCS